MRRLSHEIVQLRASFAIFALLAQTWVHAQTPEEWALPDLLDWLNAAGQSIVYSTDLVSDDLVVSIDPSSPPSIEMLNQLIRPFGLLLRRGSGPNLLVVRDSAAEFAVDVVVMENNANEPVSGASVSVNGVVAGITDPLGRITVSAEGYGGAIITASSPGYIPIGEVDVILTANEVAGAYLYLEREDAVLSEIVVTSSVYSIRYQSPGSHRFLDRDAIASLPDIGDEPIRGITRLPGVTSGGVSTKSHVRGGADNEQLIMFDGLRLYEPYHLKDFQTVASVISQSAVEGIDFYSAGYQARFGDRMSGVVDMEMRRPSSSLETELGISFFNTTAFSAGRFGGDEQGEWMLSLRRGNLDLVSRALTTDFGRPRYDDALAHVSWRLNESTTLAANYLYSNDNISLNESDNSEAADAKYRNNLGWLKAETTLNDNLSFSTIASISTIDNNRSGQSDVPDVLRGNVVDSRQFRSVGIKQDWNLNGEGAWSYRFGFDVKWLSADYQYASELEIFSPYEQILQNVPYRQRILEASPDGEQYAAYGEARWMMSDRWVLDFGLRWDRQTYSVADSNVQFSPRLNALFTINDRTELRLAAGRFYQAQEINELQINDGIVEFFQPQYSNHFVASISHQLSNGLDIRFESYYKDYRSLIPRFENIFDPIVLVPELQIDRTRIDADRAEVLGAELTISGRAWNDSVEWWGSYVWSSTEDRIGGSDVRRGWDERNSLKGGLIAQWRGYDISAAATWHTGWPNTRLIIEQTTNPDGSVSEVATTTPLNSLEHTDFNTLDFRISRTFQLPKSELVTFLEVTNLLNQRNSCCTRYYVETDEATGERTFLSNRSHWLPLVPSLGVVWRF